MPNAPVMQTRPRQADCAPGAVSRHAFGLAIESDTLLLHYQPIGDLKSGRVVALEAQPDWQAAQHGRLGAAALAALADSAGLGEAYAGWLLRRVCGDLRRWHGAGHVGLTARVALTAHQLSGSGIAAVVTKLLAEHGLAPSALTLQIGTAGLTLDTDASLATLHRLGLRLALDDADAAALSPAALEGSRISSLVIDCDTLLAPDGGIGDAMLARSVLAMAHMLGIRVAAKHVARQTQYDFLMLHLCDLVQGDFVAAPMEAAAIDVLLRQPPLLPDNSPLGGSPQRSLLLVDDEPNILASLKRLLRRDGYQIYCAESGEQGLALLAEHAVDVIVSDQRMPGMLGSDFLRKAKLLYPDTIRIMLSGYTELQSVSDAVNEGAIYKFLTKPWDDELLRGQLAEAFRVKEIADDNERLHFELRAANHELAALNRSMELLLQEKQRQISRDAVSLNIAHELLEHLPLAVIGLDDEGMIAFVNGAAAMLFQRGTALLGCAAQAVLPELLSDGDPAGRRIEIGGQCYQVVSHAMGRGSASRGSLITFSRSTEDA